MSTYTVSYLKGAKYMGFLTVKDVSEVLHISLPMAYRLANDADFPTVKLGRVIRIPEDGFRRWVERQTGGKNGDF